MPKRSNSLDDDQDHQVIQNKKQRVKSIVQDPIPVHSARDLSYILAFHQDPKALKHGIQSFKVFLESIAYSSDDKKIRSNIKLLTEYLDSQKPPEDAFEKVSIRHIIQTWHYSTSQNDDSLFSATTAVLALLIKSISSILELREHGLSICRFLLLQDQLKLLSRGLGAPSHKEYIISPTLRLLSEIVSFDGGSLSRQFYLVKDYVLESKILARNLSLTKKTNVLEENKKPSVRSNAIKYLLLCLKFGSQSLRVELIKYSNVTRALFENLPNDSSSQIVDILSNLDENIIRNSHISWLNKSHLFGEKNLALVCRLYKTGLLSSKEILPGTKQSFANYFQNFITQICTSTEAGVVRHSEGWYPPDNDDNFEDNDNIDVFDHIPGLDTRGHKINIRNLILADLVQSLKPYSNDNEAKLLQSIFQSSPELVADFWTKKINFTFEPKLTNTWIGYASIVFKSIDLDIPEFFGRRHGFSSHPPPIVVAMENILPCPLTKPILSRCLHHSSHLINLFGIRLLIRAVQKFSMICTIVHDAYDQTHSTQWLQWKDKLEMKFIRQLPNVKDILEVFLKFQNLQGIRRASAAKLLSLYFCRLQSLAQEEEIDISKILGKLLQEAQSDETQNDGVYDVQNIQQYGFNFEELDHLIDIAQRSSNFTWWKQPKALKYSLFMTMISIHAHNKKLTSTGMLNLINRLLNDENLLQFSTLIPASQAFLQSLQHQNYNETLLHFIDDCCQRFVRRPIAYIDQFDQLFQQNHYTTDKPFSNILITFTEQWQFINKSWSSGSNEIAEWLGYFLKGLEAIGEDQIILQFIMRELKKLAPTPSLYEILENSSKIEWTVLDSKSPKSLGNDNTLNDDNHSNVDVTRVADFSTIAIPVNTDTPNHGKLRTGELLSVLESSSLPKLLISLSSKDSATRNASLETLKMILSRLQYQTEDNYRIFHLLLGSLNESLPNDDNEPASYLLTTFVINMLPVLADPTQSLFPTFLPILTSRPHWYPTHLLRDVLDATIPIHAIATEDNDVAPWRAIIWTLTWLCDAIRTAKDADTLRLAGAWERILAMGSHASLGSSKANPTADLEKMPRLQARVRSLIVKLVVLGIRAGQTGTLTSRAGIWAWLRVWTCMGWMTKDVALALEQLLKENVDERVVEWSSGTLTKTSSGVLDDTHDSKYNEMDIDVDLRF